MGGDAWGWDRLGWVGLERRQRQRRHGPRSFTAAVGPQSHLEQEEDRVQQGTALERVALERLSTGHADERPPVSADELRPARTKSELQAHLEAIRTRLWVSGRMRCSVVLPEAARVKWTPALDDDEAKAFDAGRGAVSDDLEAPRTESGQARHGQAFGAPRGLASPGSSAVGSTKDRDSTDSSACGDDEEAKSLASLTRILKEEREIEEEECHSRLLADLRVQATLVKTLIRARRRSSLGGALAVRPVLEMVPRGRLASPAQANDVRSSPATTSEPSVVVRASASQPSPPPVGLVASTQLLTPGVGPAPDGMYLNPLLSLEVRQLLCEIEGQDRVASHASVVGAPLTIRVGQACKLRPPGVLRRKAAAAVAAVRRFRPVADPPSGAPAARRSSSAMSWTAGERPPSGDSPSPSLGPTLLPSSTSNVVAPAAASDGSDPGTRLDQLQQLLRWDSVPGYSPVDLDRPFPRARLWTIIFVSVIHTVLYLGLPDEPSVPIQIIRYVAPFSGTLAVATIYCYDNACQPVVHYALFKSPRSLMLFGWCTLNFILSLFYPDTHETVPQVNWAWTLATILAVFLICSFDGVFRRHAGIERAVIGLLLLSISRAFILDVLIKPGSADLFYEDASRGIKVTSQDMRLIFYVQIIANMLQSVTTAFLDPGHRFMLFRERFITKKEALFVLYERARIRRREGVGGGRGHEAHMPSVSAANVVGRGGRVRRHSAIDEL